MKLEGKSIQHISFGAGVITELKENMITVSFPQGDKKFLYPDAFERFLSLKDENAQTRIEQKLDLINQEKEDQKIANHLEQERLQRLRDLKISPKAQAAFGLIENNPEDVFSNWTLHAGHYLSGVSKGEPRIPARLKPNSACLLTQLEKGKSEKERQIIGVVMVQDDFFGTYCRDGIIPLHEEQRLVIAAGEVAPFWSYFEADEQPVKWGNTEIKYFANTIMQKILLELKQTITDPTRQKTADNLYRYFTSINRLADVEVQPLSEAAKALA